MTTLDDILNEVCLHYDVSRKELSGLNRQANVNLARQLYFLLAREMTPASLRQIGAKLKRHHATVMHGITKLSEFRTAEEDRDYDTLKHRLLSGNPSDVLQCFASLGMAYSFINTISYTEIAATIRSGRVA